MTDKQRIAELEYALRQLVSLAHVNMLTREPEVIHAMELLKNSKDKS